jgi:3-oxoacyl-[acyl-carrier-protein] synthase II
MERYEFSSDRRGFPRVLSGFPVDIEIETRPSHIPASISGEIGNLSGDGASLILDSSLPVSSIVTLRLDLSPGSPQIETKAQVMWSYFLEKNKKFSCGVRFVDLEEKHREVLNKVIGEGIENNKFAPERRRSDRRTKTKELKERLWKAEVMLKKVKKTMERRVVITGLGVIAPNGIGKDAFWEAIVQGKSGVGRIKSFDTSGYDTKIAAEISDFDALNYMEKSVAKRVDRFAQFGIAASKMALKDAELDIKTEDRDRIGVSIGAGLGGMFFYERQIVAVLEGGVRKAHPLCVPRIMPNAVSGQVSIELNLRGPNLTISTACSSGSHAIGQAFENIRLGKADIMLAGGTEAPIIPYTFAAFNALRVMSKKNESPQEASRPFDKERDGFVMGEGAGILILESLEHAEKRGAHIYAEIIGYGMTGGAHHMVMPAPEGKDAAKAMSLALEEAGISPTEVDYISAHGTSTQANDRTETQAIKKVFGEYAYKVPISSIKSMIGHLIGAAGAVELIVCALAIDNSIIPPTINYRVPDPECDLDYVPNTARRSKIDIALSNSFGFGSNNAAILISKYNSLLGRVKKQNDEY